MLGAGLLVTAAGALTLTTLSNARGKGVACLSGGGCRTDLYAQLPTDTPVYRHAALHIKAVVSPRQVEEFWLSARIGLSGGATAVQSKGNWGLVGEG